MIKGVVMLSGGLNSAVAMWDLCAEQDDENVEVFALTVNYGQRNAEREVACAIDLAKKVKVVHHVIDVSSSMKPVFRNVFSSQIGEFRDVPEAYYTSPDGKVTEVPGLNLFLLSMAGVYGRSLGAQFVCYGADLGKAALYPDARTDFMEAAGAAISLATLRDDDQEYELSLHAPFAEAHKEDIVKFGADLLVPFGMTYSCLRGTPRHCGECPSCQQRMEAFADAEMGDPARYEEHEV